MSNKGFLLECVLFKDTSLSGKIDVPIFTNLSHPQQWGLLGWRNSRNLTEYYLNTDDGINSLLNKKWTENSDFYAVWDHTSITFKFNGGRLDNWISADIVLTYSTNSSMEEWKELYEATFGKEHEKLKGNESAPKFIGWGKAADDICTNTFTLSNSKNIGSNKTYYALWRKEEKNLDAVVFSDTDLNQPYATCTIGEDGTVTSFPKTPNKTGYAFVQWEGIQPNGSSINIIPSTRYINRNSNEPFNICAVWNETGSDETIEETDYYAFDLSEGAKPIYDSFGVITAYHFNPIYYTDKALVSYYYLSLNGAYYDPSVPYYIFYPENTNSLCRSGIGLLINNYNDILGDKDWEAQNHDIYAYIDGNKKHRIYWNELAIYDKDLSFSKGWVLWIEGKDLIQAFEEGNIAIVADNDTQSDNKCFYYFTGDYKRKVTVLQWFETEEGAAYKVAKQIAIDDTSSQVLEEIKDPFSEEGISFNLNKEVL